MRLPGPGSAAVDLRATIAERDRPRPPAYVPQTIEEIFEFIQARLTHLQRDFNRRVSFFAIPITVGVAPIVLRPEENRQYLFIQNTHATQILYIGFSYTPDAANGMQIGPQGFYEPYWVPQNEISILGSGANTTGVLLYATTIDASELRSD